MRTGRLAKDVAAAVALGVGAIFRPRRDAEHWSDTPVAMPVEADGQESSGPPPSGDHLDDAK